ncbi:MAG: acyl-CoA dehydrogenase family protein [Alphaproteobacteria bacterium]|nr:acyl-CoA dehydrogenase family protein [Alphaproteobacteria bacterium]
MTTATKVAAPGDVTREDLLERARDLLPVLRERAPHAENLRRLPEETEKDFHEAGLFRMVQPARVGGAELDYGILVDIGAMVGRACGSSAWNLINLGCHHWMLGMFPPQVQDEVWTENPDALVASSFIFPAGRAKRAKGGYLVSGRWPFSSGVDNAGWNMLAAMVQDEDDAAPPEHRLFMLRRSNYEIIDTWHAAGLRGTGSKDVAAEAVFVPEHRTLAARDMRGGPSPGSAVNAGPLYRLPLFAVFPYVLSGAALGVAQGAWETHVEVLRSRVSHYTGARISEFQAVQIKLAEAKSGIDAAELVMQRDCAEAMRIAEAGDVPDIETKARFRRNGAFSVNLCTKAVDIVFGLAGGSGLYDSSPMQRAFRDAHAISAHIAFNTDAAGTTYGRIALGLPPDNPLL